jgi:putative PEP-CTERM system histidine kinase
MDLVTFSYAAAAAAYGLLTLVLILRRDVARQGQKVLLAVAGTSIWGAAIALSIGVPAASPTWWPIADALRALLWIFCLLAAWPGKAAWHTMKGVVSLAALAVGAVAVFGPFFGLSQGASDLALLGLSIIGCLVVEQLLRNATAEQKQVIRVFLWTIGAILVYDVFVFSDAVLFKAMDLRLWMPRGFIVTLAAPFFVLAAKRHPDWTETLFVSREFVFYSATLAGVGVYLITMALGAFIIREQGGEWGGAVQLAYLVAALAVLAFILTSARLKSEARVFINKHFYRNRYDYRDEWLRLIRTLTDESRGSPIERRSIEALCSIVGSDGGQLWLNKDGGGSYEPFGSWEAPFPATPYSEQSPLIRFLRQYEWVIDSRQYERDPERYQHAFRDHPHDLPRNSLIVPLTHQSMVLGLVRMNCTSGMRDLNYEDHDLLKTAGRQVAAFLADDLARQRLAETQQFDAYHKLSAFVMHDLKNLLAQQALLVSNAKKFRERPEFVDDVIRTVDNGVQRMRRLLRQLEQGAPIAPQLQRVELNKLILRAVSECSEDAKAACSFSDERRFYVLAHAEQLTSVLTHVIQNAQQASLNGSRVTVALYAAVDGRVCVEVRDTGEGMDAEFVWRKLFKPFVTTKGTSGMGIGAYQAREIIRGLGGEITVESAVGQGTTVRIVLPQAPSMTDTVELPEAAG